MKGHRDRIIAPSSTKWKIWQMLSLDKLMFPDNGQDNIEPQQHLKWKPNLGMAAMQQLWQVVVASRNPKGCCRRRWDPPNHNDCLSKIQVSRSIVCT